MKIKEVLVFVILLGISCVVSGQLKYSVPETSAAADRGKFDLSKPLGYFPYERPQLFNLFPDSSKKNKNCCNSWCFGTSLNPLLNLVSYNSFLLNEKVKFKGIRVGAELGQKLRFGIGIYRLDKPIDLAPLRADIDTINRQLRFEYYNLFWDYVVYEDFRWELSLPFSFGRAFGKIDTFSLKNNSYRGQMEVDSTSIATVGFDCAYRVFPWIGLGGGIGYRQAFAPKEIREKLNAPFYTIKIKIFLGYLFKAIFKRKMLAEEKAAYLKEKEDRKNERRAKREAKEKNEKRDQVEGIENPQNNNDY